MNYKLIAPVILLMSAAPALAEIRISGYGRFGLDYNQDPAATEALHTPTGIIDGSSTGLNFSGILSAEYQKSAFSDFYFFGANADLSYNFNLGGALWGVGTQFWGVQYQGQPAYTDFRPYISVEWGNSFAVLGGATSAASFVKPNFSFGSVFYADTTDNFRSGQTLLVGTEFGGKYFIAASYDEYDNISLAGIAKLNERYSLIAGVSGNLNYNYADGYVGLTADLDRTRIWTTLSLYSGGGWYLEAQVDYALNDRIALGLYAATQNSYFDYNTFVSYQILNDFASGVDLSLVTGFSGNGAGYNAFNLALVAEF